MTKIILLSIVCGYVALTLLIYAFQRSLMYAPSRDPLPQPGEVGVPEMSLVETRTSDGLTLVSWFAPPRGNGDKIVVLFHGNAGTLAGRGFKARYFLDAGYGVMLVGYRGFGGNPGSPTEQGLYKDARSALRFIDDQGFAPESIVLYGESLGSAVAVQMAFEQAEFSRNSTEVQNFAGVALEAPFTSMGQAASVHYPWLPARYLVRDKYNTIRKVDLISAPIYIIHGGQDKTVPQEHGRRIYEAARTPKQAHWIPNAGHVDVYDFGAARAIVKWLNLLK